MKEKKYTTTQNISYLLRCIWRWQKSFAAVMGVNIICKAVSVFAMPILVKIVIDYIENGVETTHFILLVATYSVIMLFVYLGSNYCECENGWRFPYIVNMFRNDLMRTMLTMEYEQLENPNTLNEFEKNKNNLNDKSKSVQAMINSFVKLCISILQVIFASVIISSFSPLLIIVVIIISLLQFFPRDLTKNKDKKEVWDVLPPYWRKTFNFNYWSNNFEYAKDIRLFSMAKWLYGKQMDVAMDTNGYVVKSCNLWVKANSISKVLGTLQEIILFYFLINSVLCNELTIANFTLYISSVSLFSTAIGQFLWEVTDMRNQSREVTDFRKFVELMDIEKEGNEGTLRGNDVVKDGNMIIEFQNVSFKYNGQDSYALKNINLKIEPREKLAIVGANGAGKTTFIKLLCRLYEPSEGTILLNGIDINKIDRADYFKLFAPVFQNVEVYAFTVAENISMKQDSDVVAIQEAIEKVGIKEKIESLSNGENTHLLKILYEDGVDMSGGEKQKISLARALYKNSSFIILDEPTAALDAIAERDLYQKFGELVDDKSSIFISHRLSSTRFCDNIVLFDQGIIAEYGTHDELIKKDGLYAKMYEVQAQYYRNEGEESGSDTY